MAWYNPTDPKQRNALLVGVFFVAALYPFNSLWYSDQREQMDALATRLETLQTQNRRAQVTSARGGGDLEELMGLYERHVSKLEELIPAAEEVAALIDDLMERSRRTSVSVDVITPEPAEMAAFYTKTSYQMTVVGEYHSVGRFLTEIASLSRIVTPVEVDISLHNQPNVFPEFESPIVANFRIETYVLPGPGGPPGGAGSGG